MKNAFTVFKKDLKRVFTDRRMLFSLILPGVLIFILYSFMGSWLTNNISKTTVTETVYRVAYTTNYGPNDKLPVILQNYDAYMALSQDEKTNAVQYFPVSVADVEMEKQKVVYGQYNALIVFTDDFETKVAGPKDPSAPANRIVVYYNGENAGGTQLYANLLSLANSSYKNYLVNIDENNLSIKTNLGKKDYTGAKLLSFLVPMLTSSLLFSSVISICPDTVAGEKERGTLSAMLLTPIRRRDLAIGKIGALAVTAMVSGSVSFLGLIASLPKLMGGMSITFDAPLIALLGVMILSTLLLFVSIGALVSTMSKTVKECANYLAPTMVIAMAASLLAGVVSKTNVAFAFVPFLNVSVCMANLLESGSIGGLFLGITIGANLLYSVGLVLIVARLFHSERFTVS